MQASPETTFRAEGGVLLRASGTPEPAQRLTKQGGRHRDIVSARSQTRPLGCVQKHLSQSLGLCREEDCCLGETGSVTAGGKADGNKSPKYRIKTFLIHQAISPNSLPCEGLLFGHAQGKRGELQHNIKLQLYLVCPGRPGRAKGADSLRNQRPVQRRGTEGPWESRLLGWRDLSAGRWGRDVFLHACLRNKAGFSGSTAFICEEERNNWTGTEKHLALLSRL